LELIKKVLSDPVGYTPCFWEDAPLLRSVTESLLEKDPAHRTPSAPEALRMLKGDKARVQTEWAGRLASPPFVGRGTEISLLRDAIVGRGDDPESLSPRAVFIYGPEGIGKTRLVEEAVCLARMNGLRHFRTEPVAGGIPYMGLLPMLRSLRVSSCSCSNGSAPDEFSQVVEGLCRQQQGGSDDGIFRGNRENIDELIARLVVKSASAVPVMLVAEDLEAMDEASIRVLQIIVRDMPAGRGIVVLTASSGKAWQGTKEGMTVLPLRDLDPQEIEPLVRWVLGSGPWSWELANRIHLTLGGLPLAILEALYTMQRTLNVSLLARTHEAGSGWLDSLIPRDADELLMKPYNALSCEERLLFSFICCFTNPTPVNLMKVLLPFPEAAIRKFIRNLHAEGLIGSAEESTHLSVRTRRMRELVYTSLGEGRKELHATIAAALESSGSGLSVSALQELGYQCSAMRDPHKAAGYFAQAAGGMRDLQAFERAVELYSRAADEARSAGEEEQDLTLRSRQAETLLLAGKLDQALKLGLPLVDEPRLPGPDRRNLLKTVSIARSRVGDYEAARAGLRTLVENAVEEAERIELTQELVNIDINVGGFKEAESVCLRQLTAAERLGNIRLKAAVLTDLGIATFLQDRFEDARARFEQALGLFEELGDEARIASAMTNVGNALSALGQTEEAIAQWKGALGVVSSAGTLSQQAKIQNNLGIAYFNIRKYAEARACYERSRDFFTRLAMKSDLAYTLTNLGEVLFADGDYGKAISTWTEVLPQYEAMEDRRGLVETYLQLTEAWITVGDLSRVDRLLEDARRCLAPGDIENFTGRWTFWAGATARRRGDAAGALQLLRKAHAAFQSSHEEPGNSACRLEIAECLLLLGDRQGAAGELCAVIALQDQRIPPHIRAEGNYMLGLLERRDPGVTGRNPLMQFKTAMELLAREPLAEITWKVLYALAREYFERGQRDRAVEHLRKVRAVLRHFLSCLGSSDLQNAYLEAEGRRGVLTTIERHLGG